MGFRKAIKDFIAPEDEGELELSEEEAKAISSYEAPNNKSVSNITSKANIVLFEPRNFDEAEEIGFHIKQNKACCINLHKMPSDYRQRIMDFLAGVVFGVDGSIKKVGDKVVLCSPKSLKVGGEINLSNSEEVQEEQEDYNNY